MKRTAIALILALFCQFIFAGNVTVTLVGTDPITINVKGTSTPEEAWSMSVFLYYNDDGVTTLSTGDVNATALSGSGGFNWGTGLQSVTIETGSWSRGGHTFIRRLNFSNADINLTMDDYWTTGAGVNAVICDFNPVGSGHAYVEQIGADGFGDFSGSGHTVTYVNQDASLPVQMSNMEAEASYEGVELSWTTASEVNSEGFRILRADAADGEFTQITTALIPSQGNSSSGTEYKYIDKEIASEATYYYKIQEQSTDGRVSEFGPIEVKTLYIPESYDLSQNYPNPFNPVTSFKYDLPEISDVQIRVYSLLGKEVNVLMNKRQNPGQYELQWDGTDHSGHMLASGVYFVRMQAGSYTKMRKVTLLR
ncbi:T9SS type A sorting domain-containing protein [bacterium]|nr:T9SS type A sorting domain-containing protein [bacterium]